MGEQAVTFPGPDGNLLFGVLHIPTNPIEPRIGIHLLNPGLKNRVAPNRINVRMARLFCEMGFYVLRFDPTGIGDSQGDLPNHQSVMDLWGMVQRGLFVRDTLAANDWFVKEACLEKIIMVGQCGGAVTSLLAVPLDDRIESLILVDCSSRLLSSSVNYFDVMVETQSAFEMLNYYARKVLDGRAWAKLIRGKLRISEPWLVLRKALRNVCRAGTAQPRSKSVSERFNWQLWDAWCVLMERKKDACFLYAEKDFSLKEFEQDMRTLLDEQAQWQGHYRVHVIKDANHVYTEQSWQNDLLNYMREWLRQYQGTCLISSKS